MTVRMHVTLRRFRIIAVSLTVLWSRSCLAVKKECKRVTDQVLSSDETLVKATKAMWDAYAESCESTNGCSFVQDPIAATTHLNYIPMKDTEHYQAARQACKELGTDEFPSSFCHVTSELHVSNGESGSKLVTDKFYARREPVCFPYQCANAQVRLAHPKPLGCDPDTATCEVVQEEVDCIGRPAGAGTGNCNRYAAEFAADNPFTKAIGKLNTDVGAHCMENFSDEGSDVCVSTTDPIEITLMQNFRKFEETKEYTNYQNACHNTGGDLCFMSLTAKIEGEIVFFNIDLSGDYNDYPMCFPSECEVEDRIQLHKETIGRDLSQKVSHSIKYGNRRRMLTEDRAKAFDKEFARRQLQIEDDYCPIKGMDKCVFLVADYYCTRREGKSVVQSAGKGSETSASEDSTTFRSFALAFVAMVAFILM